MSMYLSRWDSRISPVLGAPACTSAMRTAADFLRSERRRVEVIIFSPARTVGLSQEGQRKKEEPRAGSACSNKIKVISIPALCLSALIRLEDL